MFGPKGAERSLARPVNEDTTFQIGQTLPLGQDCTGLCETTRAKGRLASLVCGSHVKTVAP